MPFFLVLVGLIYYSGGVDLLKTHKQETVIEAIAAKSVKEVKSVPKQPEPVKEEVKVEIKQPDPIKEEVKVEIKQSELIKEEVQAEIKKPAPIEQVKKEEPKVVLKETVTEEAKVDETESNYLKIILYIVGAIAAIFGGFYFFSNRGGADSQTASSRVDTARRDIEENYQPESQEQPVQEETPQEPQEPQPSQEETPQETQETHPSQEETQIETQDQQQSTEDDENNNKQ